MASEIESLNRLANNVKRVGPVRSAPLMIRSWPRAILHIDADAFFASCEQALHPEYRGQPVITGQERGIVAAASYEAKAYGVQRGTPLWEVKKIIPQAIVVPSDYETYSLFSKRMFEIMRRFSPMVEEYSIDEGFVEITGLRRKYHCSYTEIARTLKKTLERELGLSMAVGLSLSKTLAKLGSKHKKPGGLTAIPGRLIHQFLEQTPIEKIWGVGPATHAYCKTLRIYNALDFARKPLEFIRANFTKPHQELWCELNGQAVYQVDTDLKEVYATIGKTKTFSPPSSKSSFVYAQLIKNLENACIKARRHQLVARGLIIFLRNQDFRSSGVKARLSRPSAYPCDLSEIVRGLFKKIFCSGQTYRASGVVLIELTTAKSIQQSLFEPPLQLAKLQKVFAAVDKISKKMGKHTVHLAASTAAQTPPQNRSDTLAGFNKSGHRINRVEATQRKILRLPGETARKHLALPLLMPPVSPKRGG